MNDLRTAKEELERLLSSRFLSIGLACLVLIHWWNLFDSRQDHPSISASRWPASLRKTSNMSPHLSGYPFYCCSRDSTEHGYIYHYSPPGALANAVLGLACTISTYFTIEQFRRRRFKMQVSLNATVVLMTLLAIVFFVSTNLRRIDEEVLPQYGLLRSAPPYDFTDFAFFCIGLTSFGWLLSVAVVKIPETVFRLIAYPRS